MNKAILVGNLTRDPELRSTAGSIPVCTFTIAINRRFKNAQGEREADFIPIVTWRQQAEFCSKYLHKGSKVSVCGVIQTRTYDAQDGTKRYVTEVVADEVNNLSPMSQNGEGGYQATSPMSAPPPMKAVEDDDLPF